MAKPKAAVAKSSRKRQPARTAPTPRGVVVRPPSKPRGVVVPVTSIDTLAYVRALIRTVPDFPKPGILFKDITPLLADPKGFHIVLDALADSGQAGVAGQAGELAVFRIDWVDAARVTAALEVPQHLATDGAWPLACAFRRSAKASASTISSRVPPLSSMSTRTRTRCRSASSVPAASWRARAAVSAACALAVAARGSNDTARSISSATPAPAGPAAPSSKPPASHAASHSRSASRQRVDHPSDGASRLTNPMLLTD